MAEVSKEIQEQVEAVLRKSAQAFASFGQSLNDAAQAFKALGMAAQLAEINMAELAKRRRAELREKWGWFCILTPEWWTWRRIERDEKQPEQRS